MQKVNVVSVAVIAVSTGLIVGCSGGAAPPRAAVVARAAAPARAAAAVPAATATTNERATIAAASTKASAELQTFLDGVPSHVSCDIDDNGAVQVNAAATASIAQVRKAWEKLSYGDGEHDVTMADVTAARATLASAQRACEAAGNAAAKARAAEHQG